MFLQEYPDEVKHVFVWGSAGTGKTLVLVECLRIMLAKCRLQNPKKEIETMGLVYHYQVADNCELIKDLEKKYLPSIVAKSKMTPKTFQQLCKGTNKHSLIEFKS